LFSTINYSTVFSLSWINVIGLDGGFDDICGVSIFANERFFEEGRGRIKGGRIGGE
jgi:hypothetical protein